MIVGMRIDDTGKNRKPVGPDDLHRTVNLTDLDLRSDPNDDSILDQDIRMPGPLGIHQQTLGNQKSFHTPRILPGGAIGNIGDIKQKEPDDPNMSVSIMIFIRHVPHDETG